MPKIKFSIPWPDEAFRSPDPEWPEGWPVPSVGQSVYLKDGKCLIVSSIDWFPYGEDPGDEPFVYVVLRTHKIEPMQIGK